MKYNIEVLALANIVRDIISPRHNIFMVVQIPDYNGGHRVRIAPYEYELKDFEYILWMGTALEFATQEPVFEEHFEPFHEEPYDIEISALKILKRRMPYLK